MATAVIVLFVLCLVLQALYGIHYIINTIRAKLRPEPTPDFGPLPTHPRVTVQLPVCNEGSMVERSIRSAFALEYPREKIQFQLCDDSNDGETSEICHRLALEYREQGYHVEHIQRKRREGYKPGNLNNAMKSATGEYIVILDADYWIPPDFLQKNLHLLLQDPQVAVVQSHFTHSNKEDNPLTQAIESSYEMHLLVEQQTRSNWDLWMEFNGSGGIWRRAVLDEMGGWPLGTAVEDVYMSFLIQPKGWKIRFSTATTCVGKLPTTMESYRRQRNRWAQGMGEILRTQWKKMLFAPASLAARQQGFFHIGGHFTHIAMVGMMLLSWPLVRILTQDPSWMWLEWLTLGLFGILFVGSALQSGEANKRMGRTGLGLNLPTFYMSFEQSGTAPMLSIRFLLGLFGKKVGTWISSHSQSRGTRYIPDMLFEASLFALPLLAAWEGLSQGIYLIPLLTLYLAAGLPFILLVPLTMRPQPSSPPHPAPEELKVSHPSR